MLLLQTAYDGIAIGIIYALFASSFSLVLGARRVWHFAHAGVYEVAGFVVFVVTAQLHLPLSVAVLIALVVAAALGLLIEHGGYRVLESRHSGHLSSFIYSLVLTTFIQGVLTLIFTTSVHNYGIPMDLSHFDVIGLVFTRWSLETIVVGGAILLAFILLIERTPLGRTIIAISTEPNLAEVLGVNRQRTYSIVMMLASLLVVPTVVLLGINTGVSAAMGFHILLIAIAASIIGGIGSVRGAALGGLLIGVVVNMATAFVPAQWQDAIAFSLMFIFIVVRPTGLLGVRLRTTGA